MPAEGISLPPKRDFGTSRWGGSKVRLHQQRDRAEGGMTAVAHLSRSPMSMMRPLSGEAVMHRTSSQ
jgi:hypothetical protein